MNNYPPAPSVPAIHTSTRRPYVVAVAITFLVFAGGIVVDDMLLPETRRVLYSDVLNSMIAGVLALLAARYYDVRCKAVAERLRITAEVNHHVRNALSAILYSVQVHRDPELVKVTQDAVERIDWVLREVLPPPQTASLRRKPPVRRAEIKDRVG